MPNDRGHGFGIYWAVKHDRAEDKEFFLKMQPPVLKIMDGGMSTYDWAYKNLPNTLIIARDWGLDDNNGLQWAAVLADPVGTAKRHIAEWEVLIAKNGIDKKRTIFMGANEPNVWVPGGVEATVKYTVALCDEGIAHDMGILALSLGVGWPGNNDTATVHDTPPDWSSYAPVHEAIKRGNGRHYLGLHSYWTINGPTANWGWLAGRFTKCPWPDVKIIIGECAYSASVANSTPVPTANQGWGGRMGADKYTSQLIEYHNLCVQDPRFYGMCVYLSDYANKEWRTKDLLPAYNDIMRRKGELKSRAATGTQPTPPPIVVPPVTPPVPPIVVVPPVTPPTTGTPVMRWPLDKLTVTQWWGRTHGGIDYSCVVGTPVKACADGEVVWVDTDSAANGGYGKYVRVNHPQLNINTFYGHLSRQDVKVGDKVKLGQVIGLSGNTGNSTGPHLHFEMRLTKPDGKYDKPAAGDTYNARIDPMAFAAGLARGAALRGISNVFLPIVAVTP